MEERQGELEPGTRLGNYEIVSKLGAGGMGIVYMAQQVFLRSEAAIKVLLPEFSGNQEIIERFFNEARAATEIQHPSIVKVFDFGYSEDGAAYIVMEYLRGEGLDGRLKRVGCLPLDDALILTRQIASALSAAHKAGIVHRDLKPDNIFLVPDPEVPGGERIKLLDFGIAKLAHSGMSSSRTRTGALMGTPAYMSPEQCTGAGKVDLRTDLYALGCILFQMLCGQPPFVRYGAGAVMAAHIYEPPPPPSSLTPMPADTEELILRLLAKSPAERFQSAESLMDAIDGLSTIPQGALVSMGRAHAMRGQQAAPAPAVADPSSTTPEVSTSPPQTTLGSATSQMASTMQARRSRTVRYVVMVAAFLLTGAVGAVLMRGGEEASAPEAGAQETELAVLAPEQLAPATQEDPPPSTETEQTPAPQVNESEDDAPPASVIVSIESTPSGADVYRKFDGLRLGQTPFRTESPATEGEFVYVLKLEGHLDKEVVVAAGRSGNYSVEMTRRRRSSGNRKKHEETAPKQPEKKSAPLDPFNQAKPKERPKSGPLDPFAK